jgi:hypothetical protein
VLGFYLYERNASGPRRDREGQRFADNDPARSECMASTRKIIADEAMHGLIDLAPAIKFDGENGESAVAVRYDEAVQVRLPG